MRRESHEAGRGVMTDAITATVVEQSHALAPVVPQDKIQLLIDTIAPGLTKPQLDLFVNVCNRRQLDPFVKQIHAVLRNDWDAATRTKIPKMTIQTGIDGFRVIAERTKEFEGEGDYQWCGPDLVWREVWLDKEPPAAARATVYRKGRRPTTMVARWDAYAQYKSGGELNSMWKQRGPEQLAKCAAALAYRAAFSEDLSGLYTDDEMGQADNDREPLKGLAEQKQQQPTTTPAQAAAKERDPKMYLFQGKGPWGGKPINDAPPADIADYIDKMEKFIPRAVELPESQKAWLREHLELVQRIYDQIVADEMDRVKAAAAAAEEKDPWNLSPEHQNPQPNQSPSENDGPSSTSQETLPQPSS